LAHLLKNISSERITTELYKTLMGKNCHNVILEYIDVYGEVIPELMRMKGFHQHSIHHVYDVLKHTCVALEGSSEDLIIRLTVLFHDIGKPDCFSMDENGHGHFYGHALKSVDITRDIFNRLKIDNKTKNEVLTLIKYHDLDLQPTIKYVRRLCYKLGSLEMVKKLILFQRADNYGQADIHKERISKFDEIYKLAQQLEQENLAFSLKDLKVDGYDMISLGLKGKQIKESLQFLLEAVLNEKVQNIKEELISYLIENRK
jgi:tRNA nucleotidyltransferase (CCA-adding enzyme)